MICGQGQSKYDWSSISDFGKENIMVEDINNKYRDK